MSLRGVFSIVLVGLLSFFDFGYYQIFEAALYYSPDTFFTKKSRRKYLKRSVERSRHTLFLVSAMW